MKYVSFVALLLAAALAATALVVVPNCIGPFFETPPSWKAQREDTRKEAAGTVRKLEARQGNKPVEEWPERDRQLHRNAKRILGETGGP